MASKLAEHFPTALAFLALSGCSGMQVSTDVVRTGTMAEATSTVLDACLAGCALEAECFGDDAGAQACIEGCETRYTSDVFIDAPSARDCLFAEYQENRCFAAMECEDLESYYAGGAADGYPCWEFDMQAISACVDYPW